jgi:ribulose-phosphate 3-epimerase
VAATRFEGESLVKIAPSLLSADFARLGEEVRAAEAAGAYYLHVDVMDGHFVDNITIGPFVVEAIKRVAKRPLDVHLMISEPARYLDRFLEAGSDVVSFHVEVVGEPAGLVGRIRKAGRRAGLAVSPDTPAAALEGHLDGVERVLVMTVPPGFGGQKFRDDVVEKIAEVRRMVGPEVEVAVDGGIDPTTTPLVTRAGADVLVAGTAVFGRDDYAAAVAGLKAAAADGDTR